MPERGRCFSVGQATLSRPVTVDEKGLCQPFSGREQRKIWLLSKRGLVELGQVAFGYATQGL